MYKFLFRLFRQFYFPEDTVLYSDTIVRLLFALYFLPLLAILANGYIGFLLNVAFTMMLPLIREHKQRLDSSLLFGSRNTTSATNIVLEQDVGVSSAVVSFVLEQSLMIMVRIIPISTLAIAGSAVANKIANCVGEAMVDSFTRCQGKDYPLAASRLEFVLESKKRRIIFLAVVACTFGGSGWAFYACSAYIVATRHFEVLVATGFITVVEIVFVVGTMIVDWCKWPGRHCTQAEARTLLRSTVLRGDEVDTSARRPLVGSMVFDEHRFVSYWWRRHIGRIRFTAFEQLCCFSLYWAFSSGPLDALSFFAETLMYLNIPHLLGFFSLAFATSLTRSIRWILWGCRHGSHILPSLCLGLPYQLLLLYAYFSTFRGILAPTLLLGLAGIWLFVRCFEICQQFYVTPSTGHVEWVYEKPVTRFNTPAKITSRVPPEDDSPPPSSDKHAESEMQEFPPSTASRKKKKKQGKSKQGACDRAELDNSPSIVEYERQWLAHSSPTLGEHPSKRNPEDSTFVTLSVPLHYAAVFEDAYEKGSRPCVVSLDVGVDLETMRYYTPESGARGFPLRRLTPSGVQKKAPFRALSNLPKILSLQSRGSYSGVWFHNARVVQRALGSTILVIFALLMTGVFLQASIPSLQPVPMKLTHAQNVRGDNMLRIDHLVANVIIETDSRGTSGNRQLKGDDGDVYGALCRASYGRDDKKEEGITASAAGDRERVSVWELALHSVASYCLNDKCVSDILGFMNAALLTDWELIVPNCSDACLESRDADAEGVGLEDEKIMDWSGFIELRSPRRSVTVVAIRGTDPTSVYDFLQDVNLFFDVAIYHVISTFVPGTSLLPSPLATDFMSLTMLLDKLSAIDLWKEGGRALSTFWDTGSSTTASADESDNNQLFTQHELERHYHLKVLHHVHQRKLLVDTQRDTLLFTGHSLGGYLSHILGSITKRPAIAFSSPGIVLSHKKYGVSVKEIHSNVVNVIPSHDIFPHLGWQGGEMHHVDCNYHTRELCHAMEVMVHTLWNNCESIRQRFSHVRSVTNAVEENEKYSRQ